MQAIILDMYGVIVKQTGDDFVPYIQKTFPDLKPEEIYKPWNKADMGENSGLFPEFNLSAEYERQRKMFIFIDDFVDLLGKYEKSQAAFGEYYKNNILP